MQVSSPQPLECLGQEVSHAPRKFLGALEPTETLLLSAFQNFSKSMEIPPFWAVANILSHPRQWWDKVFSLARTSCLLIQEAGGGGGGGGASTPFHR